MLILYGKVFRTDLANGFVPTLNGAAVEVNLESGVMINSSNVIIADIEARNGVIHAIDDILFPPTKNLVELASSFDPKFSVLLAAATDIVSELVLNSSAVAYNKDTFDPVSTVNIFAVNAPILGTYVNGVVTSSTKSAVFPAPPANRG